MAKEVPAWIFRGLADLIKDVKMRTIKERGDYTNGYIDALRYVYEWLDEESDV